MAEKPNIVAPVTDVVDDAVGVEKSYWFVAIVNHNSEKKIAEKLTKLEVENYLPIQSESRIWKNGRKLKVDRVVIPSIIFIRCTEKRRREIIKLPYISRFMTNRAGVSTNSVSKPLAVIPDFQIERLKFILCQSDTSVTISAQPFKKGDRVRVIRGNLMGLEGEVLDLGNGKSELVIALDYFGCAKLSIDNINLESV